MDFLEVGKIINTHGLRGEVKIVTWTDSPEVFEELEFVIAKMRGQETRLDLKNIKYQKNNIIASFSQLTSIEEAEKLKNAVLLVPREGKKNLLVPIIDGVLQNVDIESKKIIIEIPKGLEDE